jgi:hypothetical protein
MLLPDPSHACFADATGLGHRASAPVGGAVGFRLRRFANHLLDLAHCSKVFRCSLVSTTGEARNF